MERRRLNMILFRQANSYAIVGQEAFSKMVAAKDTDFAGPSIMCSLFALELLLKLLIVLDGDYPDWEAVPKDLVPKSHDPVDLFSKIPEGIRQILESVYSEALSDDHSVDGIKGLLKAIGKDAFVRFRYPHELGSDREIPAKRLMILIGLLGRVAERKLKH